MTTNSTATLGAAAGHPPVPATTPAEEAHSFNLSSWTLKHQPLVIFTEEPSQTARVPLLVGTASFKAELGYTVPPGTWHLTASMDLSDGRHLTTPPLELTITH